MNASFNYSIVRSWGYRNETTGKWDGMLGEIIHDGVDLGGTPLFITSNRVALVQYLFRPSPQTILRFIFRAPKLAYTSNLFVLPFDYLVWFSLGGLIMVTTIVLIGVLFVEWTWLLPDDVNLVI